MFFIFHRFLLYKLQPFLTDSPVYRTDGQTADDTTAYTV